MKNFKILIIGKEPPPYYGVSIWFQELKSSCWPSNFEMIWFSNNVHTAINTLGKITFSKVFKNIWIYLRYFFLLYKKRPIIVLVPISQTTIGFIKDSIYLILNKIFSVDTIVMLHGSNLQNWLKGSNSIVYFYFNFLIKRSKGAVVLSEKLKYIFKPFLPENMIFSIANGLDVPNIKQNNNNEISKIYYLGNLLPTKGITKIIDALTLFDTNIDYKLYLVGAWADLKTKKYCDSIISKYNLPVYYEGVKTGEEKYYKLSEADIFIFTPLMPEGHPLVIIEALALGLPIISVDTGAISDSVINNVNGFLVDPDNINDISEKLKYLINNSEVREYMGKESFKIYKKYFTKEKMINRYTKMFNNILDTYH